MCLGKDTGMYQTKKIYMKYALVALSILFTPMLTSAQKDNFFGDAGMSLARLYPGASITYNYNISRWFGVGAGAQAYDFHATMSNFQFVPAAFWDVRFNIRTRKKNQYFVFLDVGANIYKHNNDYWRDGDSYYSVRRDNGSYTGLGFGYFRPQAKPGRGRYVSLKMISNSYEANAYNTVSRERSVEGLGDQTFVISFGVKF